MRNDHEASTKPLCRLCLLERPLQNSHIISEFTYLSSYDEKHRIFGVGERNPQRSVILQKGIRERLLCASCESRISLFETYASAFYAGAANTEGAQVADQIHVRGIDYAKFKLFQISILWRAGIAEGSAFEEVRLGPRHTEKLRRMILEGDPGAPHEYGCVVISYSFEDGQPLSAFISPLRYRIAGHVAYSFLFGGFGWNFIVSSHSSSHPFSDFFVQEDGTMKIILAPDQRNPEHRSPHVNELVKLAHLHFDSQPHR